MRTAILIPTCDAYASAAAFTLERLNAWWPGHPDVFVCGLATPHSQFERCLPMAADPRDWVGIVLDAVRCLEVQGAEWLYLILDDHPPFGPCDADYLNQRLPENAAALGAIQVNLLGWDQYQPRDGVVLGPEHLFWQRNSPSFRWKFSLHPGFWHVLALRAMLESLRSILPDIRSAREFEGAMTGLAADPLLLERTTRGAMASRRGPRSPRGLRALTRHHRAAAAHASAPGGWPVDTAVLPYYRYANGPYPMFWSGFLRQGRLHEEALTFLAWTGQSALADDVRRSVRRA
jgi:hypothetical protein